MLRRLRNMIRKERPATDGNEISWSRILDRSEDGQGQEDAAPGALGLREDQAEEVKAAEAATEGDLISHAELEAASYLAATQAPADPRYNHDLEEQAREVLLISDEVTGVVIVEGRDPHVQLRMRQRNNRALTSQTAQKIGALFDAPVMRDTPNQHAGDTRGNVSYRQPPKHTHYKDDRRRPKWR